MNVQFRLPPRFTGLAVAHAVTAYDADNDELLQEVEIPLFLDRLALKIAEVTSDDYYGALSYQLSDRQVQAFSFVLGFQPRKTNALFYFEPWSRSEKDLGSKSTRLLATLRDEVGDGARYERAPGPINERELTIPTLRLLAASPTGFRTTSELQRELTKRFRPTGLDAKLLTGRSDSHFAQKVRNMVSNRFRDYSFINKGYAVYQSQDRGLWITQRGRDILRDLDRFGRAATTSAR